MAKCECGLCGGTARRGLVLPGHDQKLRADLERRVGGLLRMRDLFLEGFARGETSEDAMVSAVRTAFERG